MRGKPVGGTTSPVLRGRERETSALDALLRDVQAGQSRVLVLRGEAGAGKTALLDYLGDAASGGLVARAAGVEPETEIAYSTLQHLCAPLLRHLDRLPPPQRDALATGFGLSTGEPPAMLHIGMAVLGLFAEAAAEQPLICVVDDVQWLDRMSEVILTFVARRLDSESVALVFAARSPGDERLLDGLPELRIDGLSDEDARALLDTYLSGPVDARVRDRIVAEARGNPLALLELPRDLTAAELAFGFGSPTAGGATGLVSRMEEGFQQRISRLPPDTRTLLRAAAVEPVGNAPLLWRALQRLGVDRDAAAAAAAAGLLEIGTRVRFRHSLVRSAAWRSATPSELRAVHAALAEVTDPHEDPDRRAWHRAHAAAGPDEEVAEDLERSAGRALARGGRAAAASFLERAAELSLDPKLRAGRALSAAEAWQQAGAPAQVADLLAASELGPLDPLQQARRERLRAEVAFGLSHRRTAGAPLLAAAARLEHLDLAAARATYLSAVGVALHAGRLGDGDLRRAAEAGRAVPAGLEPAGLLLSGLSIWALDGYRAGAPLLSRAVAAIVADEELNLLWLAIPVAIEIRDAAAWRRLSEQGLDLARRTGALALLPTALAFRAGMLTFEGRFADAGALIEEMDALQQATGLATRPSGTLNLIAYRGQEKQAQQLLQRSIQDAETRGEGRVIAIAEHVRAILYNGLGQYSAALESARKATRYEDLGIHSAGLGELVEAAAHTGDTATATWARARLAERTGAVGTNWALGEQALADALTGPAGQTEVEDRYREAIERLGADGLALPAARARLLLGEWLRRQARPSDARIPLRAAHEAFTVMGADGFAERAGRELAATGETVRKRSPGTPEEFTPQEAHIARLAAAGRTNPEIGTVLFLSPRTVEWHLRKVFTKLGISSRRELATALERR
jgi:DNA-binding CsgD family transcriptional regulator